MLSIFASAAYTVNVGAWPNGANNSYLKGTYTCLMNRFVDSDGSRFAVISSVQADGNGNLTNGVFDLNGRDFTSEITGTVTGTYSIGADNNGLASVTSQNSGSSKTSTDLWAFAIAGSSSPAKEFRMVQANDTANANGLHGTGDCYLTDPTKFVSSTIGGKNFAFIMNGEDGSGNPKAGVGRITAAALAAGTSSGSITSGILDVAEGGNTSDQGATFTGSYGLPDANGRYTITFIPSGTPGITGCVDCIPSGTTGGNSSAANFIVYIVHANRAFILKTDSASGEFAGAMRLQQQATYSAASINGPFVLYFEGPKYSNGSIAGAVSQVFEGNGNGAGGVTISASYKDDDNSPTEPGRLQRRSDTSDSGHQQSGPLYLLARRRQRLSLPLRRQQRHQRPHAGPEQRWRIHCGLDRTAGAAGEFGPLTRMPTSQAAYLLGTFSPMQATQDGKWENSL